MIACQVPVRGSEEEKYGELRARIAELEASEMELKSASVVLDENRRTISALMNNLPGMAYRCRRDRSRTMAFVSQGCRSLTGCSDAELTEGPGNRYSSLIHREDRRHVFGEIERAVAAGTPYSLVYRIVSVGGGEKWVWENGHAVYEPTGEPYMLEGFIMDITDHKRTELSLKQKSLEHEKAMMGTIQAVSRMVAMRDAYTAGHEERVAELAAATAEEYGLDGNRIEGIRAAGLIHDIGKINVPVDILNKPGKLNHIEYHFVREHVRTGYEILKGIDFPWPVADIVWQHHERMDGSGYPRGLKGDEILCEARIIAVADVVEAMAYDRPYRPALGLPAAVDEISKNCGRFYDADAVAACLRVIEDRRIDFLKGDRK